MITSPPSAAERRRLLAPGTAVGVDEPMIRSVVWSFYERVRADDLIGPVFERVVAEHWDDHLDKLCDFWSSVLLMTGRFKGAPMAAHLRLEEIAPQHFERWLALFRATVVEMCPADAAELFTVKSKVIAQSLQLGIVGR